LVGFELKGSGVTVTLGFVYKDANGMEFIQGGSQKIMTIPISAVPSPITASLPNGAAKLAADQVLYDQIIDALTPIVSGLIDANTTPLPTT